MPHMPFSGFTKDDLRLFRRLDTPAKIQDFVNAIPNNEERHGDTCLSPKQVLRQRRAHCIEAAMLAAAIFRFHGERPLLVDLTASPADDDHVIAVFRKNGCWGAISKSNHVVLRYREPVYRTVRELVMSYFNEYTNLECGKKTLRSYAGPVDLRRFDRHAWMTADEDVWEVPIALVEARHVPLLTRSQIAGLRPMDPIELAALHLEDWKPDRTGIMQRKKRRP